ncbi:hypothetical protein [Deinococcus radiotolerans]|uniref:Uncharacterized protein n=1 Tax=Deinococcus radiotolerans TaxID=1309407 RepID=A0ABQ2FRH0_9DEIO|nr:hypothetical protein [Deinococcus radiotolerans]GGL19563.1 hypothetical protein GCM10010844_43150 [Deinococcus radiotolerans]
MTATHLRALITVHTRATAQVQTDTFWRALLPTLTPVPHRTGAGSFTPQMQAVAERLNPDLRARALTGHLLLFEDVNRPHPNECLISVHPDTQEVSVRIFGRYLTDLQSTTEWVVHRLLDAQEQLVITPHTRCFVLIDVHGRRSDLITGRVVPPRHRVWAGFYREHRYVVNITAAVTLLTLGVVLFISPAAPHDPLGKFYGVCERVLSAAVMNIFLLIGQFYAYRRNRRVVEWERH